MPVVGCPKCNKKYKLSDKMLGKTVKCSKCQTAFKAGASAEAGADGKAAKKSRGQRPKKKSAAAGDGPTQASKASLKDVGLSGPINPQMDLFAQPIPDKRAPDPLGNFTLEDPGFGDGDVDFDDDDDGGTEVDPAEDENKHLFANPALKSLNKKKKKKTNKSKSEKMSLTKKILIGVGILILIGVLVGVAIYFLR